MSHHTRTAAILLAGLLAAAGAVTELQAQPAGNGTGRLAGAAFAQAPRTDGDTLKRLPQTKREQADAAYREGRLSVAAQLYEEAIAQAKTRGGSDDVDAHAGLGMVHLRLGRLDAAAREFQLALQARPGDWSATYGQARLLMLQGTWEQAAAMLARGANLRGVGEGEDKYHHGLALYNLGTGAMYNAEQEALRALNLKPNDSEYVELFSSISAQRGPKLAISALEQVLAKVGNTASAPLLSELGRLYQGERLYNEARDRYVQAVTADSSYAPPLRNLADLLKLAKRPEQAAGIYLRYLSLEPQDISALLSLSQVYIDLGQDEQAAEAAQSAMAVDSTRQDVQRTFVRAGLKSSKPTLRDAAIASFMRSSREPDWTADDWLAVAEAQRDAKQFDAARQSVRRAEKLSPGLPQIAFQLGMIETSAGNQAEAITYLQQAIEMKPDAFAYHLNLGIAFLGLKRTEEGLAAMRQAIKINGQYTTGRLMLAQVLAGLDSLSAADAQYRTILSYDSTSVKALCGLGASQLRRGDFPRAAGYYRSATAADPNSADGWAGVGISAVGMDDLGKAEEALKKARGIDPANATVKKGVELLDQARRDRSSG